MEKLGPSIEDLLCYCRRSFSLKTVLLLAEQMLKRYRFVFFQSEFCFFFLNLVYSISIHVHFFIVSKLLYKSLHFYEIPKQIQFSLKPDNFLMGVFAWSHRLYLIDFGLSKRYIDAKTRQHIIYREGKGLTGTPRYASINSHLGKEQSRRDDLEALGYVLIYLYEGRA